MKESFLIDVLKKGVSPFHCVEAAMETLEESGFEELEYARPWNLKKGKAYMMNHHGTTLYAFTVGENFRADAMLRMAAAHTDYPYLPTNQRFRKNLPTFPCISRHFPYTS